MTTATNTVHEVPPQRCPRGRFAPGNGGGPGNPYARQVAALRKALLEVVTPEALAQVARALLDKAKDGDIAAAKLLLSYALGKAPPAHDPDRLDKHEWETLREEGEMNRQVDEVIQGFSPEPPLATIRYVCEDKARVFEQTWEKHREQRLRQHAEDVAKAAAYNVASAAFDPVEAVPQPPLPNATNGALHPAVPQAKKDFDPVAVLRRAGLRIDR